jgi:hydroxyacylglutathione hydrolase
MARIPLEDNYTDVLHKAQRGLAVTDLQLSARADVTLAALAALKGGEFNEAVARRVAPHLHLSRDALVQLALHTWYPKHSVFTSGFAAFNTPYEDMTVNSYVIWDERTRHAAIFDTGATAAPMLELIESEKLQARYIFLTHTHEDHVAGLAELAQATAAEVWSSEKEPLAYPGAKTFRENAFFHLGEFAIKTLLTDGHSPGGTSFYITGLSFPLAVVGDSLFASSMGGAPAELFAHALANNKKKILVLPADTALACGHGPMSTVEQEKKHNPFFAR